MANLITRRNFLKCAGVAALAVTASGIFTGCAGGGGDGISGVGVNKTVTADGVKIKLLGYQEYWTSQMVGNYSGQTMIQICFGLENQSGKSIQMGNTSQDYITKVLEAIYNNKFDTLTKGEFVTATKDGKLGNAAIGYRTADSGLLSIGVIGTLDDKKTGCIKVFTVVPKNWEQIGIQYTPNFASDKTYKFVLNKKDKIQ